MRTFNGNNVSESTIDIEHSVYQDRPYTNVVVKNACIMFTNFAGEKDRFNMGKPQFNLVLTEEAARDLQADGWNVRIMPALEEGEPPTYMTNINVAFSDDGRRNPTIKLYSSLDGKRVCRRLSAETIGILDDIRLERINLRIGSFNYDGDKYTMKGYLHELQAVQKAEQTSFDDDYADYQDNDDVY
nr:MAG TPA: hypothetical protein [Caudoviricetes sp.]